MIQYSCPECGKKHTARESNAGRRGFCKCGAIMTVPSACGQSKEAPRPPVKVSSAPHDSMTEPTQRNLAALGMVGMIGGVVIAISGVVMACGGKDTLGLLWVGLLVSGLSAGVLGSDPRVQAEMRRQAAQTPVSMPQRQPIRRGRRRKGLGQVATETTIKAAVRGIFGGR